MGVVRDPNAGQFDASGELLGDAGVIDEAHLFSEPSGYLLHPLLAVARVDFLPNLVFGIG